MKVPSIPAIHLVNSHNRVVQVYQGLTQGHMWSQKIHSVGIIDPIPTGVIFDGRSKAIVMNGKPGHLQFYSIVDDKQLYNVSSPSILWMRAAGMLAANVRRFDYKPWLFPSPNSDLGAWCRCLSDSVKSVAVNEAGVDVDGISICFVL